MSTATTETTTAETAQEQPQLLQFDPGLGIWTLVAFVLLLVLLKRFAWKPILSAVDERDRKIKDALATAERLNEDARLQGERQAALMAQAHEKAAVIVSAAHADAEALRERLLEATEAEKKRLLRNAAQEIEQASNKAQAEIRKFSAELALTTAEKILRDQMDKPRAEALANRMVQEFNP